jgi:hypothetical protein
MYLGVMAVCGMLTMTVPTVGWAAVPAIDAAETSVRLGGIAGYGSFLGSALNSGEPSEGLLGVTAGLSDLTSSEGPGLWFPDLYADAAYTFTYGTSDSRPRWVYRSRTPFALHDNDYRNTAIVRLGVGMPMGGATEAIPYVAAGYESWSRRVSGPGGYGGFYQSELLGGGLRFDVATSSTFIVSASAEGFAMIGGSGSELSQDFTGDFGTNAEERVSLDADYRLSRTWHAYAGLGINHLEYTRPKADAFDIGAALQIDSKFGIGYGF